MAYTGVIARARIIILQRKGRDDGDKKLDPQKNITT